MDSMLPLPMPGTVWLHENGNEYTVLMLTNMTADRLDYPKRVVYYNNNGDIYDKELSTWHRSRKKISDRPLIAVPESVAASVSAAQSLISYGRMLKT